MSALLERFEANTAPGPNGCREWTGAVAANGYGRITVAGAELYAHRLAWELYRAAIPRGHHVLHRCDNRRCVNPDHLFIGTNRANVDDKLAKGRQPAGERVAGATLTDAQARAIRERYALGTATAAVLAAEYGVARHAVESVLHGATYAGAGGPIVTGSLRPRGARAARPAAKLTPAQVAEIRARYARREALQRELATEYGVSRNTVLKIVNRQTHAEVPDVAPT